MRRIAAAVAACSMLGVAHAAFALHRVGEIDHRIVVPLVEPGIRPVALRADDEDAGVVKPCWRATDRSETYRRRHAE